MLVITKKDTRKPPAIASPNGEDLFLLIETLPFWGEKGLMGGLILEMFMFCLLMLALQLQIAHGSVSIK